ncbi:hypothetical protein ACWF82_28805 [Nocardia sp. NPDC055053]
MPPNRSRRCIPVCSTPRRPCTSNCRARPRRHRTTPRPNTWRPPSALSPSPIDNFATAEPSPPPEPGPDIPSPLAAHAFVRIRARLAALITGLAGCYWLVFGLQFPLSTAHLAAWWGPASAACGLGSLLLLISAVATRHHRLTTFALSAFAIAYLVTCVTWFVAHDGSRVEAVASIWLEGLSAIPALAAAVAWSTRLALTYTVASFAVSRAIHYLNLDDLSLRWMLVSVAGNLLFTVVSVVLARMALTAAIALDDTWDLYHRELADDAAARARAIERDRVADVIHDYVLGALLAAARLPASADVRREAALAVAELDTVPPPQRRATLAAHQLAETIVTRCRATYPAVATSISIDAHAVARYPASVVEVFAQCAREAVRNSYRHCHPQPKVVIHVAVSTDHLEVRVSDNGPGFSSSATGFGLSRLRARVEALPGANAVIVTEPATCVRLIWSPPDPADCPAESNYGVFDVLNSRVRWSAVAVLCAAVIASAMAYAGAATPVLTSCAAACVVIAGAYVLVMWPGDPLPMAPTTAVTLGLPAADLLVMTTSTPPLVSQIIWPGYVSGSFAMILGIRGRLFAATALTLGCTAAPLLAAARSHVNVSYWVAESISALMALALCFLLTRTIRALLSRTRQVRDRSAANTAAAAAIRARTAQREEQLATINDRARPLLEIIADRPLLPPERDTAVRLEAALRATLRAPGLSHPGIDEAVDAARTRGVHIVLIDDSTTSSFPDPRHFDNFIHAATTALANADTEDTVTIRLTPAHHANRATIVITRADTTVSRTTIDAEGKESTAHTRPETLTDPKVSCS